MPDKEQDIAQLLSAQRQKSGLSIDEIFERTRINPDFLHALEAGDFDILPPAYVRLFLKTYAKEVGLDPDEILAQYEKIAPRPPDEVESPPPEHRQTNMTPIVLLVLAFVIIIVVVVNLRGNSEQAAPLDASATTPQPVAPPKQEPEPVRETVTQPQSSAPQVTMQDSIESTPVQNDSIAQQTAPPVVDIQPDAPLPTEEISNTPITNQEPDVSAPAPQEQETPPPSPEPEVTSQPASPQREVLTTYALPMPVFLSDEEVMTLSGFVRETTQLAVSADGRQVFSGVLQAGSQQRWQARDRFQVQVQRAGAIALSLQDQPLESASPPDRSLRLSVSRTLIRVEELGEPPSDR